ncbi:L-alanine exporter AlaE [Rubellimicrobium rubrum]|uniref:L-alanine exporter AlaE n=2 Tax=Rubellimicrobium rubrum TaxID=2585369 RepID=A0A5C4MHC3_9RHOB|nr:L-alanine exporter AlaE [Rubellimicrobium rubrum]TNC42852.1 L-alanine exporter AlaE [Rubellimicrobium rubrum]
MVRLQRRLHNLASLQGVRHAAKCRPCRVRQPNSGEPSPNPYVEVVRRKARKPREIRPVTDGEPSLVFFTSTGVVNERFVAGMDWDEVARARGIGAALMVLTARPYGLWRGWVLGRFAREGRRSQLVWDTIALVSFQVPIYAAILVAGGAEVVQGCLGVTVIMLVSGRPYGLWLDRVRFWVSLPPGADGPTGLQRQCVADVHCFTWHFDKVEVGIRVWGQSLYGKSAVNVCSGQTRSDWYASSCSAPGWQTADGRAGFATISM